MRFFALLFVAMLMPVSGQAEELDLELVLLADATGSIDDAEIRFQRQGYAAALTHPQVLEAITGSLTGRIALTYVEWGDEFSQDVVVPWTVIDGAESAGHFAKALLAAPRKAYGYNAIGSALSKAQALIEENDITGLRRVIDFSADSANNWNGLPIETARAAALDARITINGLAILCREQECSGRPNAYDLEAAFAERIVGGPGSFVITVDGRDSFAEAVRKKLILEIAWPPAHPGEPGEKTPEQSAQIRAK
ncbi:DUF1194 domain-containing protein [Denitrobaculum tricleocarpae]|uniref:DUF1194 domain-containing protein n=1 Tax=Denitrobaculum tricleocarpae TaxID=2591009 RepID=A0A545TY39_9PROT|nr:DUF1194 domain-containing protein [Denitrobaculum tricleocarpae]TQV82133.1 DUF1194 domain-containing protein [Denitrobaculum tricleocarpae]